jgi:hypothetical protein
MACDVDGATRSNVAVRRLVPILIALALLAIAALWMRELWAPMSAPKALASAADMRVDPTRSGAEPSQAQDASSGHNGERSAGRAANSSALDYAADRTGYVGRVVSSAGAPVEGVTVRLLRTALDLNLDPAFVVDVFAREPMQPRLAVAQAQSGEDGVFRIDGVMPRGLCFLRLEFADVAHAPPALRPGNGTMLPVTRTPAPGEVVDLGDVRLKAGSTLVGRVVDADGKAVGGALVRSARVPPFPFGLVPIERLQPDGAVILTAGSAASVIEVPAWFGEAMPLLPIPMCTSEADGRFALYGVDPGDNVVAVSTRDRGALLRQGVKVAADAVQSLGDCVLVGSDVVDVLVRDAAGVPIANAEVLLAPRSNGPPIHIAQRVGRTNAEGRVEVSGMPRGGAIAAARRSERDVWVVGEPVAADRDAVVVLPKACTLTLTVNDASGRTLRPVQLKLMDVASDAGAVDRMVFGAARPIDLDSRMRVLDDGRIVIADLMPGRCTAIVGAAGHATRSLDVELKGDVERTVVLPRARALQVHVVDAANAVVADAAIAMQSRGGERSQRMFDMPIPVGRSDREGICALRDVPTEETRLTASHPRYGQVSTVVRGAPAEVTLQFGEPGAITGKLTDGGRVPAPGRWMIVLERLYAEGADPAVRDMPQLTMPDLEGAFAFGALQPGKYRVTSQDSAADIGTIAGLMDYMGRRSQIIPWTKAEVELHAGERAEVRIEAMVEVAPITGPGAIVRGTVIIDGAPGEGAVVVGNSKNPDRNVTSRVDRAGTFDLGRMPAGPIRVVVVPKEVAEARLWENLFSHHFVRDLTVVDGVPQELAIAIATGSVTGGVRDPMGAPVDNAKIVLIDRGGEGRSSALRVVHTDASGTFRLAGLATGSYEVQAQKDGIGSAAKGRVDVIAGAEAGPLWLTLRVTAKVSGRVDVARFAKRTWLSLTLYPLAGGDPVRGGALAEGQFEVKDVPEGRYRVEVQQVGETQVYAAGEIDVRAPETKGLVLSPQPK